MDDTRKTEIASNHSCNKCEKIFKAKSSLKSHMESIHDKILHNCDQCEFKATRKENVTRHIRFVHEHSIRFNCDHCDKYYSVKSELKYHIRSAHERVKGLPGLPKVKCPECERYFFKKSLKSHIMAIHEKVRYNCPIANCTFSSTTKSNLRSHKNGIHEGIKRCQILGCDYVSTNHKNFDLHKKSHNHDGKKTVEGTEFEYSTFFCTQCDFHTTTKSYLRSHVKTHILCLFFLTQCHT